MKRALWAVLVFATAVYSSCNCGDPGTGPSDSGTDGGNGSGIACDAGTQCPTGEGCYVGNCGTTNPDGGPNEGPDGKPIWSYDPNCFGLACKQVTNCPAASKTTLTGKVTTPSGELPLYNAIVYVPNGAVQPFDAGVSCDRCAAATGNPIAETNTAYDGTFRLENVPASVDIPLVIQLGKWRRQVTIPAQAPCTQQAITDTNTTRMPRNQSEGDIPQMAIATGDADPFECLLRKMGLDDAEITAPSGTGRVHFYRQDGTTLSPAPPAASTLWGDVNTLKQYDVVILPCQGEEGSHTTPERQAILDYTSAGGRVFATHYSYSWIRDSMTPFPPVANWQTDNNVSNNNNLYTNPFLQTVDQSFPKGKAFADWLNNVGAWGTDAGTPAPGQLYLRETRHNVNSVLTPQATRWLYGTNTHVSPNQPIVTHFTFNTPVSADAGTTDQCGRVVFSSFHVSAAAVTSNTGIFPGVCKNEPATAQEKALIFMLFDLAACVQRDDVPVIN